MDLIGRSVRSIRIVEQLGRGGMGEVYLGIDDTLQRRVAVKAVRGERSLDEGARQRFLREGRILSQLEHPNICRIYDFIEVDGNDFIILELIQGENLRQILDRDLTFSQKLDIAEQVLEALTAAHSLNVIHRDLKPENVMVTDDGQVKVLDFGLARSFMTGEAEGGASFDAPDVGPDGEGIRWEQVAHETMTRAGDLMGTPQYMSPEQARGLPVTPASDMYSFGLLLQELFSGEPAIPHDADGAELARRLAWAETLPAEGVDTHLGELINRLKALLPGDRPSAVAAAERLRWIRGKPRRRARRFAAATFVAVLVVSTVVSVIGFARASRARDRAEVINTFLIDMLASADPYREGVDAKVVDVLDQAAARVDRDFSSHPRDRAAVLYTLGSTYRAIGEPAKAETPLTASLELRRGILGAEHAETLSSARELAGVAVELGRFDESETRLRETLEACRSGLGADHLVTLETALDLGHTLDLAGHGDEAEALLRETLAIASGALGEGHTLTLQTMVALADTLGGTARYDEALPLLQGALDLLGPTRGPDHPLTLSTQHNLASALSNQGDRKAAEELLRECLAGRRRTLGEDHPGTLYTINDLVLNLRAQGQYPEAEELCRQALPVATELFGEEHPFTLNLMRHLGNVLREQARFEEALQTLQASLLAHERALGEDHPRTLSARNSVASLYHSQGRWPEAERLYRRCFEDDVRILGPEHPNTLLAMALLAYTVSNQGRFDEAEVLFRSSLELHERIRGPQHPMTLYVLAGLADSLAGQGELGEAEALLRRSLAASRTVLGDEHPQTLMAMDQLAKVLIDNEDFGEAESLYREALPASCKVLGDDHPDTLALQGELAALLRLLGRPEEAAAIESGGGTSNG